MGDIQSAFFYDDEGVPQAYFYSYTGQPVPDGLNLCLCGKAIEASDNPCSLYRVDVETGKYRLATTEEKDAANKAAAIRAKEFEIIEAKNNLNISIAEELSLTQEFETRLDNLKAELAALKA